MSLQMERRQQRLNALCERYGLAANQPTTASEDIAPYLSGEENPSAYAAVTYHGDVFYVMPQFDDLDAAMRRASEHIADGIHYEVPKCVVDLDTGDEWTPDWTNIRWRPTSEPISTREARALEQREYVVDDLQAAELTAMPHATPEGVRVVAEPELDAHGFHRVAVFAPSREALLAFVREHWGDHDPIWFEEWVAGRVREAS